MVINDFKIEKAQTLKENKFLNRFEDMKKVQEELIFKKKLLSKLDTGSDELNKLALSLLKKKLNTPSVRLYFARKSYNYITETAAKEGIEFKEIPIEIVEDYIPFITEVLMAIMYHDNGILDNKKSINKDAQLRNKTLLGRHELCDALIDFIIENVDCKYVKPLIRFVRSALQCTNRGQYIDAFYSKYENYKNLNLKELYNDKGELINSKTNELIDLSIIEDIISDIKKEIPGKADFIDLYFKRLHLMSASLFALCVELMMNLMGYEGKEKSNIRNFAITYGIMMQIVNDTADFVEDDSTAGKDKSDLCNGLKNRTITLPLIYHLNRVDNGLIKNYLENLPPYERNEIKSNQQFINLNKEVIFKEIMDSKALLASKKIGTRLLKKARTFIEGNDGAAHFLKDMLEIGGYNRYYYHIEKARKAFRDGKNYQF